MKPLHEQLTDKTLIRKAAEMANEEQRKVMGLETKENHDVILKIVLEYQGKQYECEAPAWFDEGEWRSGYEDDGVRNCQHDYASLLPKGVQGDKDFPCEGDEIQVVDYWFFNKKTNQNI